MITIVVLERETAMYLIIDVDNNAEVVRGKEHILTEQPHISDTRLCFSLAEVHDYMLRHYYVQDHALDFACERETVAIYMNDPEGGDSHTERVYVIDLDRTHKTRHAATVHSVLSRESNYPSNITSVRSIKYYVNEEDAGCGVDILRHDLKKHTTTIRYHTLITHESLWRLFRVAQKYSAELRALPDGWELHWTQ